MTVGTATVTGFQQKIAKGGAAALSYEDQIYLLKHVDEADSLQKALKKAATDYNRAAARHGKAEQIDKVLEDARQTQAQAKNVLSEAREKAKQIEADAKAKAGEILAEASKEIFAQRSALTKSRNALKTRDDDLKRREAEFEPLEKVALDKQAQLDRALQQAKAARADFDGRIAVLEKAIKQVKL